MDKPIAKYTKKELDTLLYARADQDQGRGHQPHLRGRDPEDPEVDALQGRRGDAAARPRGSSSGRSPSRPAPTATAPGSRKEALSSKIKRQEHRRPLRDADQRPGRLGPRPRRAVGGAAARRAAAPARLVRRDRAGLPLARPAGGHAVRRRGAAHQDDPPPRLVAHRRHLRLRRAHDRPAPARHRADERAAAAAARQGQHRARRRAQARDDRDRRPRRRPRPRRRHGRRRRLLRGHRRGAAGERHHHRPPPRRPGHAQGVGARRRPARWRSAARRRTTCRTSTSTSRSACSASSPASPAPARAR